MDAANDYQAGPAPKRPRPDTSNEESVSLVDKDQNKVSESTEQDVNGDQGHAASPSTDSEDDEDDLKALAGVLRFLQQERARGADPHEVLSQIGIPVTSDMPADDCWRRAQQIIYQNMLMYQRQPRDPIGDFQKILEIVRNANRILVLTGAGVSTSCGIPDFRSENGIYARLKTDYPTLPDPTAMFSMDFFKQNQKPFFDFAEEIYPGKFQPALSHRFIQQLEANNKLLKNYTQNIDTLEQVAGIKNVIQCHGSFNTASCMRCKFQVPGSAIKDDVMAKRIPMCKNCPEQPDEQPNELSQELLPPVMKPDITFFGEDLPRTFYDNIGVDTRQCDLVLVIGSSLKVSPVARIPNMVPSEVPQILINREPLPHMDFNAELLGNCDVILNEIATKLGWNLGSEESRISQTTSGAAGGETPIATPVEADQDKEESDEIMQLEGSTCKFEFHPPKSFAFEGAILEHAPSEIESEVEPEDDDLAEGAGGVEEEPKGSGSPKGTADVLGAPEQISTESEQVLTTAPVAVDTPNETKGDDNEP
eukprot:m.244321 g.244321  ORF g.244321 m.244321 type:complete len:535 (-) comp16104_c1_seq4:6014-7618(-)